MNKQIERVNKIRTFLLDGIKDLTVDQLNETPAGFNNNIIWNLGHLIAAQQGISYARCGQPVFVPAKYMVLYKPGTKPEQFVEADEVEEIKQLFLSSLDQFEIDLDSNSFANYTAWTTRYGVELASIHDGIDFILFHEGLHSGVITAMRRILKNQALTLSASL